VPKLLLLFLILSLIGVSWLGLRQYQLQQQVLGLATVQDQHNLKLRQQISYWEQVASVSPTYRDAYIQLAISYWQLAATGEAKQNLQRALELDPNWVVPPQLEPLLRLLPQELL